VLTGIVQGKRGGDYPSHTSVELDRLKGQQGLKESKKGVKKKDRQSQLEFNGKRKDEPSLC